MKEERRKKAEVIAREIASSYIVQELKESNEEFGIITITEVHISPDVSYIDFHVSALKNIELLTKYLATHAREIERRMCKKMALIKVPRVRFRYDDSGKHASHIYTAIKNLS